MQRRFFCSVSVVAVALSLGGAGQALAQAQTSATPNEVTEVVVTGSLIAGTSKDAALPVNVVTQEQMRKQGAPTVVEIIKQLPESSGVIGESNQFVAGGRGQGQYGTST